MIPILPPGFVTLTISEIILSASPSSSTVQEIDASKLFSGKGKVNRNASTSGESQNVGMRKPKVFE